MITYARAKSSLRIQKIALCTLSLSMCNIKHGMTRTNR
jgi:hypothetical protein